MLLTSYRAVLHWSLIAAAVLSLLPVSPAMAQGPVKPPVSAQPAPPPTTPADSGMARLQRADVEAWLDGFMPYALARGDIAGGVVVVVKDGQVLLQKGYGFADVEKRKPVSPDSTLFRPGSVSKLFTWTAVMQLVEQGKLELDRDVNTYIDFKIPEFDGKPITLRNIMTHTPGFEETARNLIGDDSSRVWPLDQLLKESLPKRVFAPGITPAYSNYATALAGYIVARASGQTFDDYIDQHVFAPIGMTRSTFRQPLPAALQPLMSQGYGSGSGEPRKFEVVHPAPAGSLSATGADMGKFMIAHLSNGAGLLRPETAKMMHSTTLTIVPPLNRMALGFYEQNINGHRVISHGGDTQWFHSDVWLFPDDNVGLYISVNSSGSGGAPGPLREAIFYEFAGRYFPEPYPATRVDSATARQHAQMMAGSYTVSRGAFTSFMRILDLFGQAKLSVDAEGKLVAAAVTGANMKPREFVEIAPFVWRDVNSPLRLAGKVENNQVVRWSFDTLSPFMVFDRVPWYRDSRWLMPVFMISVCVIALTALASLTGAIARRRYKVPFAFTGKPRKVLKFTHLFAALTVLAFALWAIFITVGFGDLPKLGGSLDWLLYTAQILTPFALIGLLVFSTWNASLAWSGGRGWFSRSWNSLLPIAALVVVWVAFAFQLVGVGTRY